MTRLLYTALLLLLTLLALLRLWLRGRGNPDYRKQGLPHLDRIVARFINDSGTRAAVMETQEAHIAGFNAVPPVDVKRLQAGSSETGRELAAQSAEVVFTAYVLDGPRSPNRPVTFAFNGGPGAASGWLQLGLLGPLRVVVPDIAGGAK